MEALTFCSFLFSEDREHSGFSERPLKMPKASVRGGRLEKSLNEAGPCVQGLCKPFVAYALVGLIIFLFMLVFCFVMVHKLIGC